MTKEEYEEAKKRITKGEKEIESKGGFMQAPKTWIKEYQKIAEAMLDYEIQNDLVKIS